MSPKVMTCKPSLSLNPTLAATPRKSTTANCAPASLSVKYTWPEDGERTLEISPSTHTLGNRSSSRSLTRCVNSVTLRTFAGRTAMDASIKMRLHAWESLACFIPVIVIGDPGLRHRKRLLEIVIGFPPPSSRGEGDAEFHAMRDCLRCDLGGPCEILHRVIQGGGGKLAVDQLGELAQDPVQLDHFAVPDAQHMIGEVFLVVELDGPLGFLLHFTGVFDLAFAALIKRQLANGYGTVSVP